jgi:hypothetical protein
MILIESRVFKQSGITLKRAKRPVAGGRLLSEADHCSILLHDFGGYRIQVFIPTWDKSEANFQEVVESCLDILGIAERQSLSRWIVWRCRDPGSRRVRTLGLPAEQPSKPTQHQALGLARVNDQQLQYMSGRVFRSSPIEHLFRDTDEIGPALLMERRFPVSHLVAGRRFDLDDASAVIGEDLLQ